MLCPRQYFAKIVEFLESNSQLKIVKIIGGDSTWWKDGAIHHIEVSKEEKVTWNIFVIHTNELHLRHNMKSQGMETTGSNCFKGEIGVLIK